MPRFSVLIPDGEAPHALQVVRCLGAASGVQVHVAARRPTVVRFSRHVSSFHLVSAAQGSDWLDRVATLARETGADVMLPVSEPAIRTLAARTDALPPTCVPPPLPDPDVFDRAVDKGTLIRVLHEAGFPVPNTVVHVGEPSSIPERFFPALLKARRGQFGRQIYRVDSPESLAERLDQVAGDGRRYLLQQYVEGYDIDASVLCRDGQVRAYTLQRERVASPGSFEPPLVIEFFHDDATLDLVRRLMKHLRWTGVAHVDMRLDAADGRVKILEINARFWGSLLGSHMAGVNFPLLACRLGLGLSFDRPAYSPGLFFGRGLTGRLPNRQDLPYTWRRSTLPYALADPLPVMMSRWNGWKNARRA